MINFRVFFKLYLLIFCFLLILILLYKVNNFSVSNFYGKNYSTINSVDTKTLRLSWQIQKDEKKRDIFPSDCQCQSLFTLNACNNDDSPNMNGIPIKKTKWRSLMNEFNRYRQGDEYVNIQESLFDLIRYIPKSYNVDFTLHNDSTNNRNVTSQNNKRFIIIKPQRVPFQNGFVSCGVYNYTAPEIGKCVRKFKSQFGRPLRIYFMGESIIRNIMEEIIRLTQDELDLKLGNSFKLNIAEIFLDQKVKVNVLISGEGIEFRLYWAPYLEKKINSNKRWFQGAKDILESWANGVYIENFTHPIPDILYIGSGFWDAAQQSSIDSINTFAKTQQVLKEILIKLSKKVRILWRFHHIVENWEFNLINNIIPALNYMNQLSWRDFKHSNIWIWETLSAFTTKEKLECSYYKKSKILLKYLPPPWKCFDSTHPGKMASQFAINMIWNLACNRVSALKENFCCF